MHESIWHILPDGKMTTNCIYEVALCYQVFLFLLGGIIREYSLGELFSKSEGKIRDERIVKI